MQKKRYTEQRIRKILGLNLLRLFRQVTEQQVSSLHRPIEEVLLLGPTEQGGADTAGPHISQPDERLALIAPAPDHLK